jgi:hypothetical protein
MRPEGDDGGGRIAAGGSQDGMNGQKMAVDGEQEVRLLRQKLA